MTRPQDGAPPHGKGPRRQKGLITDKAERHRILVAIAAILAESQPKLSMGEFWKTHAQEAKILAGNIRQMYRGIKFHCADPDDWEFQEKFDIGPAIGLTPLKEYHELSMKRAREELARYQIMEKPEPGLEFSLIKGITLKEYHKGIMKEAFPDLMACNFLPGTFIHPNGRIHRACTHPDYVPGGQPVIPEIVPKGTYFSMAWFLHRFDHDMNQRNMLFAVDLPSGIALYICPDSG